MSHPGHAPRPHGRPQPFPAPPAPPFPPQGQPYPQSYPPGQPFSPPPLPAPAYPGPRPHSAPPPFVAPPHLAGQPPHPLGPPPLFGAPQQLGPPPPFGSPPPPGPTPQSSGPPSPPYAPPQSAGLLSRQFGPSPQPYGSSPARVPANGNGVAGLVASALGLVAIWFANIGLVLVVAGVGLSVVGITKAEQGQATNKPVAVAGLVCGGAAMLIWLGVLVVSVLG